MKIKVFGVFDVKSDSFNAPFMMPTIGTAVRAFTALVNDGKSMVANHPEDFQLYMLAEWDDVSGVYENVEPKHFIGSATQFKNVVLPKVEFGVENGKPKEEVVS